MTLRTDHASTITPELGALAELTYQVELLLELIGPVEPPADDVDDADDDYDGTAAAYGAVLQVLWGCKQLIAERLGARAARAEAVGCPASLAQLEIAGFWEVR